MTNRLHLQALTAFFFAASIIKTLSKEWWKPMFNLFGGGIHQNFSLAMFQQMPRRDQDAVLQQLYDNGYSVPEISKFTSIPAPTLYSRVNAHRGRGVQA